MASVNVLPTDAELAAFSNPADIVAWTGLSADVWTIVDNSLGKLPHIRLIASLPLGGLKAALQQARVPVTGGEPRELNLAESIQVGLVWRASRKACGMADVDPFQEGSSSPVSPAVPSTSAQKKVKLSQVLDQVDETETPLLGRADMDQAFANHVAMTGLVLSPTTNQNQHRSKSLRCINVLFSWGNRLTRTFPY